MNNKSQLHWKVCYHIIKMSLLCSTSCSLPRGGDRGQHFHPISPGVEYQLRAEKHHLSATGWCEQSRKLVWMCPFSYIYDLTKMCLSCTVNPSVASVGGNWLLLILKQVKKYFKSCSKWTLKLSPSLWGQVWTCLHMVKHWAHDDFTVRQWHSWLCSSTLQQ